MDRGGPLMSATGQLPSYAAEQRQEATTLRWERLDQAITDFAREEGRPLTKEKVREAAITYAAYINSCEPEELTQQYQLDRAIIVLERADAAVVTLAEGANLRSSGSSSSRGISSGRSSGSSRDIGRTSRNNSNSNRNSNRNSNSTSGTNTNRTNTN